MTFASMRKIGDSSHDLLRMRLVDQSLELLRRVRRSVVGGANSLQLLERLPPPLTVDGVEPGVAIGAALRAGR